MSTLSRRYPTPTSVQVGVLGQELSALAMRVYETLLEGPRLVWVDEKARVYSSDVATQLRIQASAIAGTYVIGQPITQIEQDIQALHSERTRDVLG